jgi:hypothetical protein
MKLLIALRCEILKTRRTSAFYLALGAAAFGPLMSMLDLILDGMSAEDKIDILNRMLITKSEMTHYFMLPMFIMLSCTLLHQVEYRNNTWKQVLTSSQTKGNVFAAKFINFQLLILVFLLINKLLILLSIVILHFMKPSLHVFSQPLNWGGVMTSTLNAYFTVLAICSIQFWLGLRFRNFIAPVGIGIACWFIGSLLVIQSQQAIAAYFPYSFHMYGNFPDYQARFTSAAWTSLAYTVLFLALGYMDFRKRRMSA